MIIVLLTISLIKIWRKNTKKRNPKAVKPRSFGFAI